MQKIKYFSTFTGIGGFELGIGERGECVGFSEVDKYAVAVYQSHFPNHQNYGDITKIDADALPDFDLLVGGFPCQAFSIAGKRGGFSDTRGTLFFDLARILKAKRPRLCMFENVKGLLSHDEGRTFTTIISALDELGYDIQWQVLNSKNHGVPQNRERVFIVGHLRGTPRPEIFPFIGADGEADQAGVTSTTIDANYGKGIDNHGARTGIYHTTQVGNRQPFILAERGRYRADGTTEQRLEPRFDGVSNTLTSVEKDNRVVVHIPEATKKGYAEATVGQAINLAVPNSKTRRGRVSDIAQTLDTGMQQYTLQYVGSLNPTPRKGTEGQEHLSRAHKQPARVYNSAGINPALSAGETQGRYHTLHDHRIRRLTPIECERLQGFPDNWTASVSDTQRYKQCGNAVTVNVIRDICERLLQ